MNICDVPYMPSDSYRRVVAALRRPLDEFVRSLATVPSIPQQLGVAMALVRYHETDLCYRKLNYLLDFLYEHVNVSVAAVFLEHRSCISYLFTKMTHMPLNAVAYTLCCAFAVSRYVVTEHTMHAFLILTKSRFPPKELANQLADTFVNLLAANPQLFSYGASLRPLFMDQQLGPFLLQNDRATPLCYTLCCSEGVYSLGFDVPEMLAILTSTPLVAIEGNRLPTLLFRAGRIDLLCAVIKYKHEVALVQNDDGTTVFQHIFGLFGQNTLFQKRLFKHGFPTSADLHEIFKNDLPLPYARLLLQHVCFDTFDMSAFAVPASFTYYADTLVEMTRGNLHELAMSKFQPSTFFFPFYKCRMILSSTDYMSLRKVIHIASRVRFFNNPFSLCSKHLSCLFYSKVGDKNDLLDTILGFLPRSDILATKFLKYATVEMTARQRKLRAIQASVETIDVDVKKRKHSKVRRGHEKRARS